MGALVEDSFSKRVTHVLSMNSNALLQQVNHEHLQCFKGVSSLATLLSIYHIIQHLLFLLQ